MSEDIVADLRYFASGDDDTQVCRDAADEIERLWTAIDAVLAAIDNEGIAPDYHRAIMARHRREWPTLWLAIDRLRLARNIGT